MPLENRFFVRFALSSFVLTILLGSFAIEAKTGREGGGGGGIRMPDGKIYTMAQAGLKFADNQGEDPFYVDSQTMRTAKQIVQTMKENCLAAFADSACNSVVAKLGEELSSNNHTYKKVEIVRPELFNRMKNEYQSFVHKLPIKGTFVLPAYTEERTTYLFPDFFASDLQTRAIYLIHEAMFSYDPKISLERVLRVEVAIVELLQERNPRTVRALRDSLVFARGYSVENELVANYLEYLFAIGKTVALAQLFEGEILNTDVQSIFAKFDYETSIETSPYTLSENKHIDPEFFKMFLGKELRVFCGISNPSEAFAVAMSDLEFRGVQLFNKKTGKKFGDDIHGADKYLRLGNQGSYGRLSFRKIEKVGKRK